MANQNQNGRNVALPDENRPSWRPQDQAMRGRSEEDRGRSWRDRDDRDEDRFMSERGERARHVGQRESRWDEDRDEGYRMSERYGQGQSGYAAGRYGEDRAMQGMMNRNQGYAGGYEDRQHGEHLDDRFSGRGGQGYWQDRGNINQDRQFGGGRGYGGYEGERITPGYSSGYNQGAMGYGGYGSPEQGRTHGHAQQGFGQQGYPQGRTGGYAPQGGYVGRSGPWQQGHQGRDQSVYGRQGLGEHGYGEQAYGPVQGQPGYGPSGREGEPQRQRGMHRGKGPQGYQRSDERIREMVCEALTDDDNIDASTIEVTVKSGEVILTGSVPDRHTKRLAEDVVERCSGVKDVQNQIKVIAEHSQSRGPNGVVGNRETETQSTDKKHRA